MKRFTYHEPKTVEEAVSRLSEFVNDGMIKAGGTDLLVGMKMEIFSPQHLVDIRKMNSLAFVSEISQERLRIGALTTLRDIERSPLVRKEFPVLWQAASSVASPHIRNRATLGGNICLDSRCPYYNQSRQWLRYLDPCVKRRGGYCYVTKSEGRCCSIFSADTVSALIVLGARVKLIRSAGERVLPLADFYTGVGNRVNRIRPEEMLTEIEIPVMKAATSAVYHKVSDRDQIDFPMIGIAAKVSSENGTFGEVDVVIIGTGPGPVRLIKIGEKLAGQRTDSKIVEEVCGEIPHMLHPISNAYGLAEYKGRILPSRVAHAIKEAVANLGSGFRGSGFKV